MNIRRGAIRLWIVLSLIWMGLAGFYAKGEYARNYDIPEACKSMLQMQVMADAWRDCLAEHGNDVPRVSGYPLVALVALPPLALLALGLAGVWVIRGFGFGRGW